MAKPARNSKIAKTVMVVAPKGGTGKTMTCKLLLSLASQEGLNPVGVDVDPQYGLALWAKRRPLHFQDTGAEAIRVVAADWNSLRSKLPPLQRDHGLIVIDTPATIEAPMMGLVADIASDCDLCIMPVGQSYDDIESVLAFYKAAQNNKNFHFLLSKIKRKSNLKDSAREALEDTGPVYPFSIPDLVEFQKNSEFGLCPADFPKNARIEEIGTLWDYVRFEIGLKGGVTK